MKTYYSIIKIAHNNLTDDTLSIGILLHDGIEIKVLFSEEKKSIAKKLISESSNIIDVITKQIIEKVSQINKNVEANKDGFFPYEHFISGNHFNFLNSYSNGLLRFSKPFYIDDIVDELKFNQLFKILVDKNFKEQSAIVQPREEAVKQIVHSKLISRVSDRVHTNINVSEKQLSSLFFNFPIDCLGKNGALIGAKSISFEKGYETIDKDISHYFYFSKIIAEKFPPTKGKNAFYIIGEEPKILDSREHKIWDKISKSKDFIIINPDESDKVASVVERKKATEFLDI